MIRRSIPVTAVAIALATLPACSTVHGTEPNVRVTDTRLNGLSFEGVRLLVDVELNNPTRQPIAVESFAYGLTLANEPQPVATGKIDAPATLAARTAVKETVPITLSFADLAANVLAAKPGSVLPYVVEATAETDIPGAGPADLEGERTGELPVPAMPDVRVVDVTWKDSGVFGMDGAVTLDVTNNNSFPVDLQKLKWSMSVGGKSVVGGKVPAMTFAPGATEQVIVPVSVSTLNLGRAVFGAASSGNASYEIAGDLRVKTPYGVIGSPFRRSGATTAR